MGSNEEDKKNSRVEVQLQVARNVLRMCEKEALLKTTILDLNDYEGRTAQYIGLPRSFVSNLRKCQINSDSNSQPFDVTERLLVLKALLQCYSSKINSFPTFSDIFDKVQPSLASNIDFPHFRSQMTEMGFDYRKTTNGCILAEDVKLTFERFNYLKKIRMCKSLKMDIYYIDERVIDESATFPKLNFENTSVNETSTILQTAYIFYHVFSDIKLENYFFTNKKCTATYMKWVEGLINILKPKSLIVIDNHPLHGKLNNETMTPFHTKIEMKNWLIKNRIPYSNNMNKAELYELISRSIKHNNMEYSFDILLKAHGFDVLRLPSGCCDLSPASLFWKDLPRKAAEITNTFTPTILDSELPQLITEAFDNSWKRISKKITHLEDQFINIDAKIELELEKICKFDIRTISMIS